MRFVLLTPPNIPNPAAITDAVNNNGAAWWHYFRGSWLIEDPQGRNIEEWDDIIRAAWPGQRLLLAVEPTEVFGLVPQEIHGWFGQFWLTQD